MGLPLYERAKSCSGCLEWHDVCNAECCRQMRFAGVKQRVRPGQLVELDIAGMTPDIAWWYRLHGVQVDGSRVRFRAVRFTQVGDVLTVFRNCDNLVGNLCKEHASGDRPEHCKDLVESTSESGFHFLTPNCLFKHKAKDI